MTDRLTRYSRRVVLIGQAPCRKGDPSKPLTGSSGLKLAQLAGVEFPGEYARLFERVNVLREYRGPAAGGKGDAFPLSEARAAAKALMPELRGRVVVVLGRNVARAFELHGLGWTTWWPACGVVWGVIPHPSPLVRWWNDSGNRAQAASFMMQAAELSRGMHERWVKECAWLRASARVPGYVTNVGFGRGTQ